VGEAIPEGCDHRTLGVEGQGGSWGDQAGLSGGEASLGREWISNRPR